MSVYNFPEYVHHMMFGQTTEARLILLDPERGVLAALFPQLASASVLRRRGVAGVLRNCCYEASLGAAPAPSPSASATPSAAHAAASNGTSSSGGGGNAALDFLLSPFGNVAVPGMGAQNADIITAMVQVDHALFYY